MDVHPTKNGIYRYWSIAKWGHIWASYPFPEDLKDTKLSELEDDVLWPSGIRLPGEAGSGCAFAIVDVYPLVI